MTSFDHRVLWCNNALFRDSPVQRDVGIVEVEELDEYSLSSLPVKAAIFVSIPSVGVERRRIVSRCA